MLSFWYLIGNATNVFVRGNILDNLNILLGMPCDLPTQHLRSTY